MQSEDGSANPWSFPVSDIDGRERPRHGFRSVNWRTSCTQFSPERIAIAILAMVRFGVRVGGCAHILKIRFCKWPFIWRQGALGGSAGAKQDKSDEGRENG